MEKEIIKILVQRINHLETVLFSSALGFLITTTLAIFAALYILKTESKLRINPSFLMIGTNIIYVLLSGYYYFILTHFYATASTLIPFKSLIPDSINIDKLWTYFRFSIPFLKSETQMYLSLLNAPLFPLLFSMMSITGVWYLINNEFKSEKKKWMSIGLSLILQSVIFYLMIWYPFRQFIKLIMINTTV